VVNAALAIATQVNGVLYGFIGNFQVAFNPQIVQSYASGEYERNKKLILTTSKYSFFLMAILSAPFLFFTKSILTLWLGNDLPAYAENFIPVIIFCSIIDALAGPFWISAQAIGSIKEYNITLTVINLFTLPLAYVLLKMGYAPIYAFVGKFFIAVALQLFRYYFINKYIRFNKKHFASYIFRVIVIFALLALILMFRNSATVTFIQMTWKVAVIELLLLICILLVGLENEEKKLIWSFLKNKLQRAG